MALTLEFVVSASALLALKCLLRTQLKSVPFVLGWIERTEPNPALEKDLDKVKPLELAALYGNYGVWHDLLATLVDLRLSHPEDSNLTMMWENLLKSESVKLEEISQAPLVESTPVEY
jgi:hypothetical protein